VEEVVTIIMFPRPAGVQGPTPPQERTLEDVAEEFLDDQRLAGRSQRTVDAHASELRRLRQWLISEQLNWLTVTPKELKRYCRPRAHKSHSTRSNLFCSLRRFFSWCVEEEYYDVSPVQGDAFKTPKRPKPMPKALTRAQVRVLIDHLASQDRLASRRDEMLILFALYTGFRASELAKLRWSQVDLSAQVVNIRLSKMGKGRAIPLNTSLMPTLRRWKEIQNLGPSAPVFSSMEERDEPITAGRVGKIARRVARDAELDFTTHILRHTFATWALRRSRDLYGVSKSLGHEELKQTEIYVSADTEELREVVESLFKPDEW
jgi:integrase/recombinase XerD